MSGPLGFAHRHEHGPRGALARWWYDRRVRHTKAATARINEESGRTTTRAEVRSPEQVPPHAAGRRAR